MKGDEARLQAILHEWETSPEAIQGDGIGAELVRVIRKIAQGEERLRVIAAEMAQLEASDLHQLKTKVEEAEREGQDLLIEMAARIDKQIVTAKSRLGKLVLGRTST